jgi:hypothetical protein
MLSSATHDVSTIYKNESTTQRTLPLLPPPRRYGPPYVGPSKPPLPPSPVATRMGRPSTSGTRLEFAHVSIVLPLRVT